MGDASYTRDQFDETKKVLRKIYQKGTYIADADANEAGQIDQHRAARMLYNLIKQMNVRFGYDDTDWTMSGGTNSVTVSAGDAALILGTEKAYVFHLGSNQTIDGWTTPDGSDRTDYLYIDAQLLIIDSDDDATLINPDVGKETAVDLRLQFEFKKQEGGSVPAAPDGHYYVTIATIERHVGNSYIPSSDITNHLDIYNVPEDNTITEAMLMAGAVTTAKIADSNVTKVKLSHAYLESNGSVELTGDQAVTADKKIDGVDLSKIPIQIYSDNTGLLTVNGNCDDLNTDTEYFQNALGKFAKRRVAWYRTANAKYAYMKVDAHIDGSSGDWPVMHFEVFDEDGTLVSSANFEMTSSHGTYSNYIELKIDVSTIAVDTYVELVFSLEAKTDSGYHIIARRLSMWAGYE